MLTCATDLSQESPVTLRLERAARSRDVGSDVTSVRTLDVCLLSRSPDQLQDAPGYNINDKAFAYIVSVAGDPPVRTFRYPILSDSAIPYAICRYFAHWRGLGISMLYTLLYGLSTALVGHASFDMLATALHMLWTHSMNAHPTIESLRQRLVPLKPFLPFLVFATQQATFFLPLTVAFLNVPSIPERAPAQRHDSLALALMALRIFAVLTPAALLALFVLLPQPPPRRHAAHRPFDSSFAAPGLSSPALFVAAWRSFDRPASSRSTPRCSLRKSSSPLLDMTVIAAEVFLHWWRAACAFLSEWARAA
ncbi:hypothetical protein B0H19DRAFT_1277417 [Mycena capillaripes]|nr:hypothetical protein B0H19DRAFT_1277417 [Mycena capillaripes]